jgi:lipopolysaccharide export system protein LptC
VTARAETTEQRSTVYRRLVGRNRIVAVLRLVVPALGVLAFAWFAIHILLASFVGQFKVGNISFDGGTVIVDTPSYSGVMADGDIYKVGAEAANTTVTNLDVINLTNASLLLTKPSGDKMVASAKTGAFNTVSQIMTVPGAATMSDSNGNTGTMNEVVVNLPDQTLKAAGHVHITTPNGMVIDGDGLDYASKTAIWTFGRSTVTLPDTSGGSDDDKTEAQP